MRPSGQAGVSQAAGGSLRVEGVDLRCGKMVSMISVSGSLGAAVASEAWLGWLGELPFARDTTALGGAAALSPGAAEGAPALGRPEPFASDTAPGGRTASIRAPGAGVSYAALGASGVGNRSGISVRCAAGRTMGAEGHWVNATLPSTSKPATSPSPHHRWARTCAQTLSWWKRTAVGAALGARRRSTPVGGGKLAVLRIQGLAARPPHIHAKTPGVCAEGWAGCGLPNRSGRETGSGLIVQAQMMQKVEPILAGHLRREVPFVARSPVRFSRVKAQLAARVSPSCLGSQALPAAAVDALERSEAVR